MQSTFLFHSQSIAVKRLGWKILSIIIALFFCAFPALADSQSALPSVSCPDRPPQKSVNKVTIHIAEALSPSGVVCVHVTNGFRTEIKIGPDAIRLQIWQRQAGKSQFHDYESVVKERLVTLGVETSRNEREEKHMVAEEIRVAEHETRQLIFPSDTLPSSSWKVSSLCQLCARKETFSHLLLSNPHLFLSPELPTVTRTAVQGGLYSCCSSFTDARSRLCPSDQWTDYSCHLRPRCILAAEVGRGQVAEERSFFPVYCRIA